MVNMPWGSNEAGAFVKNVGLVTTAGPNGPNIMACEWTYQLSYEPAIVGVSVGPHKATYENIQVTKEFGVCLASTKQATLAHIAGNTSGKKTKKFDVLKELGFEFEPSLHIAPFMVKGAALHLECKLMNEIPIGDHTLFVGEVIRAEKTSFPSLAYHQWKFWNLTENIPKPNEEERERQKKIIEKHAKKK